MYKKKVISVLIVVTLILGVVSINFSALADSFDTPSAKAIFYLTDTTEAKNITIGSNKEIKVVKPSQIKNDIAANDVNIWVDSSLIDQSGVKEKLNNVYKSGGRIIIKGNNLKRNDVRTYFGVDIKDKMKIEEMPNVSQDIQQGTAIGTKSLGMMIYQENGINNVTNICGNEGDSQDEINKVFLFANQYDYIALVQGRQPQKVDLLSLGPTEVYGESYNWNNVDVDSRTDSCTRLYISMALNIDKNAGNPNSNGEYLYKSTFRTDITVRPDSTPKNEYCISEVNLQNFGSTIASIYDYGPRDQGPTSTTISFSLPWGVSVSFSPYSTIKIEKTAGGISFNQIAMDYIVKNYLGLDGYDFDGMWCENCYEAYQTSNYYTTRGNYYIHTWENVDTVNGDFIAYPIQYYPGTDFVCSGYN